MIRLGQPWAWLRRSHRVLLPLPGPDRTIARLHMLVLGSADTGHRRIVKVELE